MSGQDYEQLTLFQEGSPASPSVLPESAEAVRMTAISGRKCLELSKKSGPLGSLEKMLLESSIWRSTRCFLTWKVSATPQGRLLFRLVPSTPRTGGTGASLWRMREIFPTPRAQCANGSGPSRTGNRMDIQTSRGLSVNRRFIPYRGAPRVFQKRGGDSGQKRKGAYIEKRCPDCTMQGLSTKTLTRGLFTALLPWTTRTRSIPSGRPGG